MTKENELKIFAAKIRIEILKMLAEAGSGHLGGEMDLADLLAVLYSGKLNIDTNNPNWEDRDYVVMSKGHAGPALYATLALKGYFPIEMLATLNKPGTHLPSHCDRRKTPGIDMTAGSLGQGIGAAVGIALGNQTAGKNNYTYCIIGDGESQEGSVWEAMLLAPQFKLKHFIVILDNNGLQIDGYTKDVVNIGDVNAKAKAFGWNVFEVDGHDVNELSETIDKCKEVDGPTFINMHTTKAKGWAQYENIPGCHHVMGITKEAVQQPIELLQEQISNLENC